MKNEYLDDLSEFFQKETQVTVNPAITSLASIASGLCAIIAKTPEAAIPAVIGFLCASDVINPKLSKSLLFVSFALSATSAYMSYSMVTENERHKIEMKNTDVPHSHNSERIFEMG